VATDLPEIAITLAASLNGQIDVAVSNVLGGVAIQTVVLVALDAFGVRVKTTVDLPGGKPDAGAGRGCRRRGAWRGRHGAQLPKSEVAFRLAQI